DWTDIESRKQFSELVFIKLAPQLVERGCQRLCNDRLVMAALPEDAHAVSFLSQVYELEIDGEGPRDSLGAAELEAVDQLHHACQDFGGHGATALPQLDGGLAQTLDVFQEIGPAAFNYQFAQG